MLSLRELRKAATTHSVSEGGGVAENLPRNKNADTGKGRAQMQGHAGEETSEALKAVGYGRNEGYVWQNGRLGWAGVGKPRGVDHKGLCALLGA